MMPESRRYPADRSFLDGGLGGTLMESIWDWLQMGVNIERSATVIISLHQSPNHLSNLLPTKDGIDQEYLIWTYNELEEASLAVAQYLSDKCVGSKDVITTLISNGVEWAILSWAALRLGATFVPLDPSAVEDTETLKYLLGLSGATVILVNDDSAAYKLDESHVLSRKQRIKAKLACSSKARLPPGWQCLEDIGPANYSEPSPRLQGTNSKDATALLMFTSGTTSKPKGCEISHASFCAQCDGYRIFAANPAARWSPDMRFVMTVANVKPLYWLAAFSTWRSGGAVVISGPAFDPHEVLKAMAELKTTHAFLVPRTVRMLANHPDLVQGKYVPSNMRFVNITGDVVDRSLVELCKESLHVQSVISVFGMTEGAGIVNWDREGDEITFTPKSEGELVGVGRILPGSRIKVCAPGSRELLERGQVGDLHVNSPNFIHEYLEGRNPDDFYEDEHGRWLSGGDKAKIDDDGIIYLIGRDKDMIKKDGKELAPAIIEALLNHNKAVKDIQVVGVSQDQGEVPVAVVKLDDSASLPKIEEVNEAIGKELGAEYRLSAIRELQELGYKDWPYNAMGKIVKKDIAKTISLS